MTRSRAIFIAWAAVLAGFVLMSALAALSDKFPGDVWLAQRVQEIEIPGFSRALDLAAATADLPEVVAVCAGAVVLLWLARDTVAALIIPVIVSARVALTWTLKELIERPRPSAMEVHFEDQPSTFAFPSGHAISVFVLYGLLFYFAALHTRDSRLRFALQATCVVIIVMTGLQRIYVGHHWPSDVLGGYYAGALIVVGVVAVHRIASVHGSNLRSDGSFTRAAAATDPE